ncbi:MAG: cyclase/dehydrase, partial [Nitrosospira sp.]
MYTVAAFAAIAIFATSSAQAFDVKSPGVDWTEAYRTPELVIFTQDVEKGRRIIAVGEM